MMWERSRLNVSSDDFLSHMNFEGTRAPGDYREHGKQDPLDQA